MARDLEGLYLDTADFALLFIAAIAAVMAGLAYAMIAREAPNYRAARVLAWAAAAGFWSLPLIWGVSAVHQPLSVRMIIGAIAAGIVAAGLIWALADIKGLEESHPSPERGPNDGGDSFGPGGAGGGGLGGRGGAAHGTGGGGGGGAALGGGGGGGGEGASGGAGGVGGGGGGGGKGASGGPGGPGAIIMEWTIEKPSPHPATLYQSFQNDAYTSGYVGRGELVSTGPNGILKIEINLAWGVNCGPTSLWLHVPETEHLYEELSLFSTNYREALSRFDMQRKLPSQSGCTAAPVSSAEARFSGKMYVYNEKDISPAHQKELRKLYAKNGVSIEFRGAAYLAKQIKNWSAAKAKTPHKVVVMMVGDDAPASP